MDLLITASLAFPTVMFSLMLSVVLVYWVFVILGAVDMHLFDIDADVGGDFGGDIGSDVDVDAGVDTDADADADGHGNFADILSRLDLTEIPLTVSLSVFTLLAWLGCAVAVQLIGPIATTLLIGTTLAVAAASVSLLATSQIAVFLKPMFKTHYAPRRSSLVGKVCRIKTLTVTDKHGQAEVDDGGAGLVIQVRSSNADELSQGAEALIFNYDAETEIFSVKPLGHA